MSTPCFQPTPAWSHALEAPACPRHLLLVTEDEEHIVGWCRLFPIGGRNCSVGKAELGIGLLTEYREHGLGSTLVNRALDWAAITGVRHTTLTTRVDNCRAIRLFESCGFKATRREMDGWIEMTRQTLSRGGRIHG